MIPPPNGALEILSGIEESDVFILELSNPIYDSESQTLQYEFILLEEGTQGLGHYTKDADAILPQTFGTIALFIDNAQVPAVNCVPAPHKNLSNCDLSNKDLTGINFAGANLSGVDLSRYDYLGFLAPQIGIHLAGANLKNANLSGADLSGADLSGADLSGTDLTDANLNGADFTDAIFDGPFKDAKEPKEWDEKIKAKIAKAEQKAKQLLCESEAEVAATNGVYFDMVACMN